MEKDVRQLVSDRYGAVARGGARSVSEGADLVAQAFGYSAEELAELPGGANMGLSCGNPTAMAGLKPGEVVVDLGSGGGIDVLLAAKKVGPQGRAIGIDMTPDMIALARRNAAQAGADNAEFRLGEIEHLPLDSKSVDCVISNCVLNLVADKRVAFDEIFRVLKPGGRLAVSDIALKQELPAELAQSAAAYVGCIAGALHVAEYEASLRIAGFADVQVIDSGADLNAYAELDNQDGCCAPIPVSAEATTCCGPTPANVHEGLADLMKRHDINQYAAAMKIFALKPGRS